MTTIKLYGGDLGNETMLVRCNLTEASAPVQVDYCEGDGWVGCQYQCAETRHRTSGLVDVGVVVRFGFPATSRPEWGRIGGRSARKGGAE